jgi:menaquinone-dependent protoporphyrinogen oxidase
MANVSRRNFLKTTGITVGAATLACAGFSYGANRSPVTFFPETSYGDQSMEKRILVAYASKCGSTAEVADAVGESISKAGLIVDVKPVSTISSVAGYDAVVVGSAIRYGAWLTEATEFLMNNQTLLQTIPAAIFTVHMLNLSDTPEDTAIREGYLKSIKEYVDPVQAVFFAGKMDFSKLSFFEKIVSKAVNSVEADKRDWDQIRRWGSELPVSLSLN